ncbi:hypothetical protein COO91_08360 [Nostoc flagelliforme CCNUN1]|uniref:Uncharacterized protein n=1 Tax=Nostoc flagelliforme CCNUN1 TaxID=2038116 RepID=A0A2K8T3F2_9NOSO|nr:hypothetical protein COO91_08360 [Nostoc flagelliforme CCNUN1]
MTGSKAIEKGEKANSQLRIGLTRGYSATKSSKSLRTYLENH